MSEDLKSRLIRYGYNIYPSYRRTGARVIYVAKDYRQVKVKLPLNWKTRNPFGSIFGGSLYAALDPVYTMMIIHIFGRKSVIAWTKAANIAFIKPGYSTLFANFIIENDQVNEIRTLLENSAKIEYPFSISLISEDGVEHVKVDQTVYIRKR